ncbi:bifunctional aspartate kinase/homoserine dehydrogenase I [Larkinella ripae]
MNILKFGGTSVKSAENIRKVIAIIENQRQQDEPIKAVVLSAMGGVTNQLIEIARMAAVKNPDYLELIRGVEERHFNVIKALIPIKEQSKVKGNIRSLINELEDLLRGVFLIRELSDRSLDLVMSFGEKLSCLVISECLKRAGIPARYCDASALIRTDDQFGNATVDEATTNDQIRDYFRENSPELPIVTGFIGSTKNQETTTLGRGGSDYTASILAAALDDVTCIDIWTDVDGMMTADPRKVTDALPIPTITYTEAMELSHFGAKVIYPPTLQPAFAKNIPIRILNTFNPTHEGTLISKDAHRRDYTITGISSIDDVSLVNIQGSGMVGVTGFSAKLFQVLAERKINVILISQASSEHSICIAVEPRNAERVSRVLETEFANEIRVGKVDDHILIEKDLSIIAIVGEGMKKSSGISGKLFSELGKNGINVVAIAQGSSEINISVVINKKNLSKALNAIHNVFFQPGARDLNLYLIGTGLIGRTLLQQLQAQHAYLRSEKSLRIKLVGVSNTKKMLLDSAGIDLSDWKRRLDTDDQSYITSLPGFVNRIKEFNLPNSVFIDCTADKEIPSFYEALLDANVSVVTPNKVANSGSYASYRKLQQTALRRGVKFLYETNVGAGLPIINTLQGLVTSGDRFLKIEAILSGTLSYIFNTFRPGVSFAAVVQEAKEKGFTEPDPREDLGGMDVARKILILAREAGFNLEPTDVTINNLLPESCIKAPNIPAFFVELERNNAYFENLLQEAENRTEKLRYVATFENGKVTIELRSVGFDHPFYALSGADNIISFTTERYKERPLVIKGPGAGAEVTASGVFADVVSIGSYLA